MSKKARTFPNPRVTALVSVVDRAIAAEREVRASEVQLLEVFAEAFDLAATASSAFRNGEDLALELSTPTGERAELEYRAIRAELACALNLSETTIEKRMGWAWELRHCFGGVLDAYRDGDISAQHAQVITDAGSLIGLGKDLDVTRRRGSYTEQVLVYACEMSPNRLRPVARRLAEQFAELTLDARHEEARTRRSVCVREAEDGMADLIAHLPAAEAYAVSDRLRSISRAVIDRGGAAGRTRREIAADVFIDLLLSNTPSTETHRLASAATECVPSTSLGAIRAQVQVLIPAELLGALEIGAFEIGVSEIGTPTSTFDVLGNPTCSPAATLQGYGPIDTRTARELAGGTVAWDRIHTHPETHEVVNVDRYRPSEHMKRLLRARDQHCRFPGCRSPLARCDIDHTVDAALGGPTATNNLAHLCRAHHTLKHQTGWSVVQRDRGVLDWTSPAGKPYRERPPSTVMFAPAVPDTPPGELR